MEDIARDYSRSQTAIKATSLQKSFTSRRQVTRAIEDVSFEIAHGERIACIGPNGAGKSTTIKILTGILEPTSGDAEVLGFKPSRQRKLLTQNIGVLFGQRAQLWSELNVREGLSLLATIYGLRRRESRHRIGELGELLDAVELLDLPVQTLSLGQRMRCELAAALIHNPKLLFLDEPTIGLDLLAKQRFRELLVRLNENLQTTIFLTSHDIPDVEAVAQRVIVINAGRVLVDDNIDNLRGSLLNQKMFNVRYHSSADLNNLKSSAYIIGESSGDNSAIEFIADTNVANVEEIIHQVLMAGHVADISISDPPLEDVIAELYKVGKP